MNLMPFPSNKTLLKIAIYVGVGGITSIMYLRYKVQERIRSTEYFRLALKELRQHEGAVSLLGEPIKESGFDIGDEKNNYCDGQKAQFEVTVKGSKDRGKLFFWATRDEIQGWLVDRLEVEVKSNPNKRYLLKKIDSTLEED